MLKHWKRTLALLGVVTATGLVCAAPAAAKKPSPPPPPQPQVTVRYEMTVIPKLTYHGGNVWANDARIIQDEAGETEMVVVVGRSYPMQGSGEPSCAYMYVYRPKSPDDSELVDLNTLIDPSSGFHLWSARGINNSGQIAGFGTTPNGEERAYRLTPPDHPDNSSGSWQLEDLGTLGGVNSTAFEINDDGEVVGYSGDSAGRTRAFLYTTRVTGDWRMVDIGDLGGGFARAYAINNFGQVAGESSTASGAIHAFRYTPASNGAPAVMEDLTPLAKSSRANNINDAGDVVGRMDTWPKANRVVDHAFLYTDARGLIDLGTLGANTSEAYGINGSGEVVGWATTTNGTRYAFLYTNKTDTGNFVMVKLDDLILDPPTDPQMLYIDAWDMEIKDSGHICAKVVFDEEPQYLHGCLLTPVMTSP